MATIVSPTTPNKFRPLIGFYDINTTARLQNDTLDFGLVQPGGFSKQVGVRIGNNLVSDKSEYNVVQVQHWNAPATWQWNRSAAGVLARGTGCPAALNPSLHIYQVDANGNELPNPFKAGAGPSAADTSVYPDFALFWSGPGAASTWGLNQYVDDGTAFRSSLEGIAYNPDIHGANDQDTNYIDLYFMLFVPVSANGGQSFKFQMSVNYTAGAVGTSLPNAVPYTDGVCSPISQ